MASRRITVGASTSASAPIGTSSVAWMPSSANSMRAAGLYTMSVAITRKMVFTAAEPGVAREGRFCSTTCRLGLHGPSLGSTRHDPRFGRAAMSDRVSDVPAAPAEAVSPSGINHLVLNVRDIDESHKFWTEIVGFKQVGELHSRHDRPLPPKMRLYSAVNDGKLTHHTVALVESPNLPPAAEWALVNSSVAINHVALTMPSREAWLRQLAFLQSRGVKFNWRGNHGATHRAYINDPNGYGVEFLYEMPREMWENDIDAGINWLENLPTEGPEALVDRTDTPSFGRKEPAAIPAE